MLEKFYKYKVDYSEYIVLIKIGNFYECFNNDAFIMNNVFGYKPKRLKNSFKAGFPINRIDEVTNKLEKLDLFYIVVDNDIIKKYDKGKNKYNDYNFNIDIINYNYLRIEKICSSLYDKMLDKDISNILNKIEDIMD